MTTSLFVQLLVNGLIVGTLYGVVAMSFVLIYKASQIVNFAQGEFLLIGAWVCWWIMTDLQLPFFWSFILTLAFQQHTLRPLVLQVTRDPALNAIFAVCGSSRITVALALQQLLLMVTGLRVDFA